MRHRGKQLARGSRQTRERRLLFEPLEHRTLLTLVGFQLDLPLITYDGTGTVDYDAGAQSFKVEATPQLFFAAPPPPVGFFNLTTSHLNIDIQVDNTGNLIGGTPNDFVLAGDLDTDGDGTVDFSGTLLTGKVTQFGYEDAGPTIDVFDFRATPTGGELLSAYFDGRDIGVTTISENSFDFVEDFTVNFSGGAKGNVGTTEPLPSLPDIDIEKFVKVVEDQPGGGEGLTPGFWKNHTGEWEPPYDTGDNYNQTFGIGGSSGIPGDDDSLTLLGALQRGGGQNNALGRHATAGLLNAAEPNVDYAFTVDQIILLVQDAYTTGDFEPLKNLFAIENEQGADLGTPPAGGGGGGTNDFGDDADDPPGPSAQLGDTIQFTYFVTNPGEVALDIIALGDDNATPEPPLPPGAGADDFSPAPVEEDVNGQFFNVGDDDYDGLLDPGEQWVYTATTTAAEVGQFTNTAKVTGNPVGEDGQDIPGLDDVMDDDPANYVVEAEVGGEGFTPGFWKTHSRFGPAPEAGWPDTGFDPEDLVDDAFILDGLGGFGDLTLLEALQTGGGGVNALMRHAVAALLNAANPNIDYAFTVAEVKQMLRAALVTGGDVEGTKDLFAEQNEIGGDLSPGGGSDGGDNGDTSEASIQGIVWVDSNSDGRIDSTEQALKNVTVTLTGADVEGNQIVRSQITDGDGVYMFADLPASDANGYVITEEQPAGFDNDREYAGALNGVDVGDDADVFDDEFTIVLAIGDVAEDFNFAEQASQQQSDVYVEAGLTATIGFWQNKNGQNLIKALNGGKNDTALGDWLATTFPNLYGTTSQDPEEGLAGKTNEQVAVFFKSIFKASKKKGKRGGSVASRVDPQFMAVALGIYVTDRGLAGGAVAEDYGFSTFGPSDGGAGMAGLGGRLFDIDAALGDGTAVTLFGADTPSTLTVMDILIATDGNSSSGVIFESQDDDNNDIDWLEGIQRSIANDLFAALNETGDIK